MTGGVANSDFVPDPFPGISLPSGTGAQGTEPPRSGPPDSAVPASRSGLPGVGTVVSLSDQAGQSGTASTSQPGQTASSVISPGPDDAYSSTGATGGSGHADHWPRQDYQQRPGG